MKALLLESPKNFQRIEIDEPQRPGPGEALVRVHRIGICGTDLSGYLGKMPFFSYPRIPGHELGVEVVEVGEGVTNVKPGDRCSVEPYINDPNSYASRRGHPNCCEKLEVLGVHRDGGMRPVSSCPPASCIPRKRLRLISLRWWKPWPLAATRSIAGRFRPMNLAWSSAPGRSASRRSNS